MKKIPVVIVVICICIISCPGFGFADDSAGARIHGIRQQARSAFQTGDFAAAAALWQEVAAYLESRQDLQALANTYLRLAETCQAAGHLKKARFFLDKAHAPAMGLARPALRLDLWKTMGRHHDLSGDEEKAAIYFDKCLAAIDAATAPPLRGAIYLNYANHLYALKNYAGAATYYRMCLTIAEEIHDPALSVKARVNLIRTDRQQHPDDPATERLALALDRAGQLPDTYDKAMGLISIGRLARIPSMAYDALTTACRVARAINNPWLTSFALGALGQVYTGNGQIREAMQVTRQALDLARQIDATDILFRWQWDLGRQYGAAGDLDSAIAAYRQAVENVSTIREDLTADCRRRSGSSFRQTFGPVYLELADLLLKRNAGQADLADACQTVEQMKKMELQEYFQDDCVIALQARQSALDRAIPGTAVIYPVLLPDRTELVVIIDGAMTRYRVGVEQKVLIDLIRVFRKKIQQPGSRFLRYAQKLYHLLIRPFENDLAGHDISFLVFVPDGPLRTIPMSCLHDGQGFLVEKYALATTPGLTVTDLVPFRPRGAEVLLAGLTKGVQGFSPLPGVAAELGEIRTLFKTRLLMDHEFVSESVSTSLRQTPFSVVHIASHGQFGHDPGDTFILTHDSRLSLNALEELMAIGKFRKNPVELLTLSACQTAAGDDRSALGLAGIAVKSGARSALASLWFINDTATSRMVADFYKHLSRSRTKADSLRLAQMSLIDSDNYSHPAFWAPFLLIGSWL